jgi:hypothetical protein
VVQEVLDMLLVLLIGQLVMTDCPLCRVAQQTYSYVCV